MEKGRESLTTGGGAGSSSPDPRLAPDIIDAGNLFEGNYNRGQKNQVPGQHIPRTLAVVGREILFSASQFGENSTVSVMNVSRLFPHTLCMCAAPDPVQATMYGTPRLSQRAREIERERR